MNGLTHLEPDYSEFVEVDPTGRYGRVYLSLSLSLSLSLALSALSLIFGFLHLLQYNDILGK
jgi:hypothetical protein